jgi:hypothetical protein
MVVDIMIIHQVVVAQEFAGRDGSDDSDAEGSFLPA